MSSGEYDSNLPLPFLKCSFLFLNSFNLNQSGADISFEFDIKGHHKGNPVRKIDFTPENWMVTAAKTIKIFDLEYKKRVRKLTAGDCKIYSLIVLDNYLLAAGDDNGCFRLYDYRVNENTPRMELRECNDYISDLDADVAKRIVLASSGEGTLTAFNVRAKKMDKPQSELFDSGFNCVRVLDTRAKVLVGSDEGVISMFNWKQWGNISDRFPVNKKSSVESIELLDASHILIGNGDGKTKLASVFPNEVVSTVFSHTCPVECVRVNLDSQVAASCAGNEIKVASFADSQSDPESEESSTSESSDDEGPSKRKGKNSKNKKSPKKNKKEKSDFFSDLQ